MSDFAYDVVIVGSGFGGSVAALRLSEKGYRVLVLEAGRRFADADFARTSWDLRRFLWAPRLGCYGIQRIHLLDDVLVLAGAGVGGGSLVYGNTLYRAVADSFYDDPQWGHIADWRAELAPHYDEAARMLGVVTNPSTTPSDRVLRQVADSMGLGHTHHPTPVGVFFGRDGRSEPGVTVPDPFFGGRGPARTGCRECGECFTGCRHGAKNTLVKNYLALAEGAGAEIRALTTVTAVRPRPGGGYAVETARTGSRRTGAKSGRAPAVVTAEQVILAAGTWGTQNLLHRMKADGILPGLSDRLGELTRTNSEAICAASVSLRARRGAEYHRGVAITSAIHPDEATQIEPCRYGVGSSFMALLATTLTDGEERPVRAWLRNTLRRPGAVGALYGGLRDWPQRTIVALVMQARDNSLTTYLGRRVGGRRLASRQGHGSPNPAWIPAGNDAVRRMAELIDGHAYSTVGQIVGVPMTAHFLGGCVIGDSVRSGVVDAYHRVFGHPGLHVVDGSTISANLGVNPALTITAQAERAMARWPNRGEADPRPALGEPYVPVDPVAARAPVARAPQPVRAEG